MGHLPAGQGHSSCNPARLAAAAASVALVIALTALAPPTSRGALAQEWNPFVRHQAPVSNEAQRAQRRQMRNALAERMEGAFKLPYPLLSQQTIDGLQRAITHHEAIVESGGFPRIPEGTYRLGESGQGVTLLRQRLVLTGDLRRGAGRTWQYDAGLQDAVAHFQSRHGLRVTGFVDARTLQALNVPAQDRLRQLRTNMKRILEMQEVADTDRYVIVNSPFFQLEAVEKGGLVMRSNVVVGKPGRETPDVSTKIVELNFLPYWHVPESIANRDLIPTLRKDPGYFDREHFSVLKAWGTDPINASAIDWRSPEVNKLKFRQDPGPHNALGLVRINMPNKHIVYLHDTPLKQLFNQSARAFSSGCVRVERVLDLAAWLVQNNPDWTADRVQATAHGGEPVDVKLKTPVPVHFIYVTAMATPNGLALFRPDIYRRDGVTQLVAEDDEAPRADAITP